MIEQIHTIIGENIAIIIAYTAAMLAIAYKEWNMRRIRKNIKTATELIESTQSENTALASSLKQSERDKKALMIELRKTNKKMNDQSNQLRQLMKSA